MHLKDGGTGLSIADLYDAFEDGIVLIRLLEVLSASSLGRYETRPKIRIQKIQNVNKAIAYISSTGVRLENMSAEGFLFFFFPFFLFPNIFL